MKSSKRIIIVGGVAGGMSCATRLRRLDEDANITIIDKGPYVSYANCGIPYALGGVIQDDAKLHVQTAEKIHIWFNVDVRTNTELLEIDRASMTVKVKAQPGAKEILHYDKLVLAMGAEAVKLPVPGVGSSQVFLLQTIPDLENIRSYMNKVASTPGMSAVQCAAVIGGGFLGLEAAENLRNLGLKVTIFELLPHVLPPVDAEFAEVLHQELRSNGVELALGAKVTEITEPTSQQPGTVCVEGQKPVPADLVIMAIGIRARSAIARAAGLVVGSTGVVVNEHMQTTDPNIYSVGDMVETRHLVAGRNMQLALAGPANRQGRMVADHICGRDTKYRGNVGTSICKVFDMTIGLVGPSTNSLSRLGIPFEFITVHPPHHAGYYPGPSPMTIKVAFNMACGKILGAQIIGAKGVDKRVDVIATAMQAHMRIDDLEHLELAYSPPYGAAKDAVNMVGFVGGNVRRGDVRLVHACDLATGAIRMEEFTVLDVRTAEEYNSRHLVGATRIPITTLRQHTKQLDKSRPVLVYCWVGYRGYLASRLLTQSGFDVWNLDGGLKAASMGGCSWLITDHQEDKTCIQR